MKDNVVRSDLEIGTGKADGPLSLLCCEQETVNFYCEIALYPGSSPEKLGESLEDWTTMCTVTYYMWNQVIAHAAIITLELLEF